MTVGNMSSKRFRYSHTNNLIFNDAEAESAVVDSVAAFRRSGGGAIVDNSTFGLDRRTAFLKDVSVETGVHVVAGTGFYVEPSLGQVRTRDRFSNCHGAGGLVERVHPSNNNAVVFTCSGSLAFVFQISNWALLAVNTQNAKWYIRHQCCHLHNTLLSDHAPVLPPA